jgi:CDP-diacylglycerol pyrophosphatase
VSVIDDKVAHVKQATQTRAHSCHWPGCTRQVAPALWGCRPHWYALPAELRAAIWRTYRVGQESDLRPSSAYLDIARRVQEWIASQQGKK